MHPGSSTSHIQPSNMSKSSTLIILGETDSFSRWDAALRARLAKRDLTGHVIHDDPDVDPVSRPIDPIRATGVADADWEDTWVRHRRAVLTWKNHETEARNIILERLSEKVWPRDHVRLSAKALYDSVSTSRKESSAATYIDALRQFHAVKFSSTIEEYCDAFQTAYQNIITAAENLSASDATPIDWTIPEATAAGFFLVGTIHVPWLSSWRDNRAIDSTDRPISLHAMMSSLRTVAANNHQLPHRNFASANAASATTPSTDLDPEARCNKCMHVHKNKNCFKQHPELAVGPAGDKWRENMQKKKGTKGKGKAVTQRDEEEDDNEENYREYLNDLFDKESGRRKKSSGIAASASIHNKLPLIYDTGASHHFMPLRSMFCKLYKRPKPFNFDQAVGASSLSEQGNATIKIGHQCLRLSECLYSPNSASGIVSAGRLQRLARVFPDYSNKLLIKRENGHPDEPVARLNLQNDVYFIHPLHHNESTTHKTIAAPGVAKVPTTNSAQRWHQRLGHIAQKILKSSINHSIGLEGVDISNLNTCETCHLSKAQRFVSREPRPIPNDPLDEVFVDTIGKLVPSTDDKQYAIVITDAKTRMRWVLTTKTKDQIATTLVQWVQAMHHQYDKRVRTIFRDGGSEFSKTKIFCEQHGIRTDTSAPYTPEQNGPSEAANKVVLRVTRSMLIDAKMPPCYWSLAMQHACFILNRLYCIRTKKVPMIDFLQGLQQPHMDKIDLRNLPRFGCRAYKLIHPKPSKFEPRAEKGWFLGFQINTSKNFLILHPHKTSSQGWKWIVSSTPHATFNEDIVFGDELSPINKQQTTSYWTNDQSTIPQYLPSSNEDPHLTNGIIQSPLIPNRSYPPQPPHDAPESDPHDQPESASPSTSNYQPVIVPQSEPTDQTEIALQTVEQPPETPPIPLSTWLQTSPSPLASINTGPDSLEESDLDARLDTYHPDNQNLSDHESERQPSPAPPQKNEISQPDVPEAPQYDRIMTGWDPLPPLAGHKRAHSPESDMIQKVRGNDIIYLNDEETDSEAEPQQSQPTIHSPEGEMMRTKRGRQVKRVDYYRLHHGLSAYQSDNPKTWDEAMFSPEAQQWKMAAIEEIKSLVETGTFVIINRTSLPQGRKPMKSKWVFKKKFHADGSVDKWKARCTAKGYTQRPGIDYQETFAPTPRPETGRIMLVLAHHLRWHRCQGDVPTAFLNPDLKVDLYMELPKGFERDSHVILLRKGLYGLKQAAALWYDDAKATLAKLGLHPTTSDVCLYANKQNDLFVLLHVDDFQVMGPNREKIDILMNALNKKYKLKRVNTDLFLGIHIKERDNTLELSQGQYARTLLKRHGLEICKPANTPLERLTEPNSSNCSKQEHAEYNSIIGGLQYLANNTRPDIAFSVNHMARFLANPSAEHLLAARRILRYIAKQPDKGITFTRRNRKPILEAYSDADFAADPSTSRSTSGTLIRLACGPIFWKSHLQREVVLSTTEAEYLAATETCRQLQWIKALFEELALTNLVEGTECTNLYVDNQSAISLIKNHDNHRRSKHIALRNHYCREQYKNGRITVTYIPSADQLSDALTKAKTQIPIH